MHTVVIPKMAAVIIVTAIHVLIFCPVQQRPEVSAHCVPAVLLGPGETAMTESDVLPTLMESTVSQGAQDTIETPLRDIRLKSGGLPGGGDTLLQPEE